AGSFQCFGVMPSRDVRLGDRAFTVGFPNTEVQGISPKVTEGIISGLSGARDDARYFQVSVPVQPGNSGGALVDVSGNVIGIITARLSELAALKSSGALPQNVNYALKSSYALALLESLPNLNGKLKKPSFTKDRQFPEVVRDAEKATVLVKA